MSVQTLSRYGVGMLLAALVSGCASNAPGVSGSSSSTGTTAGSSRVVSDQCTSSRSRCLYNGAYESGERNYAEQEAKRLNLAELERLRRAFSK